MSSTVSVLIPTYDRDEMLRATVESVLRQTHRDLELLIGVDRGTDDVVRAARSFTDPRVQVTVFRKNRGPYPVYEDLLKRSKGDYVLMFSDDDLLEPVFLERCLQALESGHAGFAWTDDIPWDGTNRIPDPRSGRKMPFLYPGINETLFRREALERIVRSYGSLFRPDLRVYGDCVLYYHLSQTLGPEGAVHVNEPLVWNRMHPRQLSRNPRLWSLVEDVIVGRAVGQPMRYRQEVATLVWLLKKKAETVTGKPLPRMRA